MLLSQHLYAVSQTSGYECMDESFDAQEIKVPHRCILFGLLSSILRLYLALFGQQVPLKVIKLAFRRIAPMETLDLVPTGKTINQSKCKFGVIFKGCWGISICVCQMTSSC